MNWKNKWEVFHGRVLYIPGFSPDGHYGLTVERFSIAFT